MNITSTQPLEPDLAEWYWSTPGSQRRIGFRECASLAFRLRKFPCELKKVYEKENDHYEPADVLEIYNQIQKLEHALHAYCRGTSRDDLLEDARVALMEGDIKAALVKTSNLQEKHYEATTALRSKVQEIKEIRAQLVQTEGAPGDPIPEVEVKKERSEVREEASRPRPGTGPAEGAAMKVLAEHHMSDEAVRALIQAGADKIRSVIQVDLDKLQAETDKRVQSDARLQEQVRELRRSLDAGSHENLSSCPAGPSVKP
ncbi:uncharacterized protein AB675_113 [Cyphellophora attinorum]|uniref:Uncharacterized protein n=1 Tax=Cyphellophora attinorum TaxID=1664694 RepID=A0A0N1NYW3_9EURO|nr:uncharacterized protein AB675_113 [Phialophora attinorum]KPI37667.1 hypothetical protein AB675_113 [Phialophora attinorum]